MSDNDLHMTNDQYGALRKAAQECVDFWFEDIERGWLCLVDPRSIGKQTDFDALMAALEAALGETANDD